VHGGVDGGLQTDPIRRPGGQQPQLARLCPPCSVAMVTKDG
jgi:hypothetical protein